MALTYTLGFKQAYVNAITPLFNGRTFQILDGANAVLGSVVMPADVFADADANAQAFLNAFFDIGITTAGTVAKFRAFVNSTEYEEGTVGTSGSGADLIVSKTNLGVGDTVRIDGWTISFPA